MKNKLLYLGLLAFVPSLFGQQTQVEKCATVNYMNYRESIQPGYIQATKDAFNQSNSKTNYSAKSDETYVIPVVVHVVYNTPNQNLPDSVILDQIRVLNEDYNRMNADSVNLRSEFLPYAGKANIQFKLAEFDPQGNPTNGITRTQTSTTSFMDMMGMLSGDMSSMEKVKSTANGGIDPWNQSRYLNIWVCNMAVNLMGMEMPMLLGYATPPANLPNWPAGSTANMSDGVVIQYQVFGSNNPNPFDMGLGTPYNVKGRTATHEVGHYLGLRHVWGDGDCSQDDGIADTPNAADQSQQDCDNTKNTCTDNIGGVDLPDMIENFMDYSAEDCQNTFTAQQVDLMRSVLEDHRFDLINNNPALSITKVDMLNASMYPNPANGSVTITTDKHISGTIVVIDLNGKEVLSQNVNGVESTLNITSLSNGVYQVVIVGANGASNTLKLVKL